MEKLIGTFKILSSVLFALLQLALTKIFTNLIVLSREVSRATFPGNSETTLSNFALTADTKNIVQSLLMITWIGALVGIFVPKIHRFHKYVLVLSLVISFGYFAMMARH